MKKIKCYNCKEINYIKRNCKKLKKNKINSFEKKNDSNDNNKKINKKIRKTNSHLIINSDATDHCTDNQSIFENLIIRINKLTTADEFLKIVRKKNTIIILLNKFIAKLDDILFMSNIKTNLLF